MVRSHGMLPCLYPMSAYHMCTDKPFALTSWSMSMQQLLPPGNARCLLRVWP